jgi:hypothetical protein
MYMRRAALLTLVLALPLEAQLNVPSGISHAQRSARDSLPRATHTRAAPRSRALLKESVAGIGGALLGVAYMGAAFMNCNDRLTVADGSFFESSSGPGCLEHSLIGIGIVGPVGAALATSMARSVTGTPGSSLAAWGGALLGTVIGAGASVLVSNAFHEIDPAVSGISLMVLGQGTFAALAGRKPHWEK